MAFDPSTFVSTPNTWLETRVRYEGAALAEFTTPPGVIEGPATACFNAAGACRVRIKVERIEAPDQEKFSLRTAGTLGAHLVHGEANPCTSLTVRTDAGVFTGGDRIIHDGLPPDAEQQVELRPIHAEGFATVVISGGDQTTLNEAAGAFAPPGGMVRPIVCHVADRAAIDRLVQTLIGEFGRFDALRADPESRLQVFEGLRVKQHVRSFPPFHFPVHLGIIITCKGRRSPCFPGSEPYKDKNSRVSMSF